MHYRRNNENSSVKSTGKVYCVCDEYAEIERFIHQKKELCSLYPVVIKMKYQSFYWNFRRILIPEDIKFAMKVSCEFKKDFLYERVKKNIFKMKHYRRLYLWAYFPKLFFLREYIHSNGRNKIIQYLKQIF